MITTQHLCLRPLVPEDLEPLHAILSDPGAMRYWSRPAHDDIAQTREFLNACLANTPGDQLEYAVTLDGVLIGRVGMWQRYEIGYILSPSVWGKGFATEALGALIPQIFDRFPEAEAVTAEVDPRNIASVRVLEKLGFELVRVEERNFLYGGPEHGLQEWCDTAYYSLARGAFGGL